MAQLPNHLSIDGWTCNQSYLFGAREILRQGMGILDIEVPYNCRKETSTGGQREVSYILKFKVDASEFEEHARRALHTLLTADGLL